MAIQQTYSKMKIVFFKFHSSINSFLNWRFCSLFLFSSIYNRRRCNGIIRMEFNSFSFPFSSSSFSFNDSWFLLCVFFFLFYLCVFMCIQLRHSFASRLSCAFLLFLYRGCMCKNVHASFILIGWVNECINFNLTEQKLNWKLNKSAERDRSKVMELDCCGLIRWLWRNFWWFNLAVDSSYWR